MSEAQKILSRFEAGRQAERQKCGQDPAVCIAGEIAYLELETALRLLYDGILVKSERWQGWMTFAGVRTYCSNSVEPDTFYFGHEQQQPLEAA